MLPGDAGLKPIRGCRERTELFASTAREIEGSVPFIEKPL
jgi:hypothetical protein